MTNSLSILAQIITTLVFSLVAKSLTLKFLRTSSRVDFLKNSSITLLDEIHNHYCLNPKYYLQTPRFIKKCFMIRKHKIPKFICFRLCLSLILLIFAPVGTIIYFCMNCDLHIIGVMIMGLCIFGILDIIQIFVLLRIFKRYRR